MNTPSGPPPAPLDCARPDNPRSRQISLIWLVLILVIGGILIAYILCGASGQNARRAADRVISASNLRQIGQGIFLYSNDNHGQYPDSLQRLVLTEGLTPDVFVHLDSPDTAATGPTTQAIADNLVAGGHLSYVYLGRGMNSHTITPDTVVAYERTSFDGNGGINILFGDGHVDYVPANLAAPMLAKVAAGQRSVRLKLP